MPSAMRKKNENGFSMVELLVYSFVLILILGVMYNILITNTKSYSSQENSIEMVQHIRAAMELMVTEIRMAGCDPTAAGSIGFVNDADDRYDTDANSIHFTVDDDANGAIANAEDINYYLNGSQEIVRRLGDGSEPILAENITALTFSYGFADGGTGVPNEADGDDTNDRDDIRSVQITMTGETGEVDPITKAKKTRSQSSWVVVRNAGLNQ